MAGRPTALQGLAIMLCGFALAGFGCAGMFSGAEEIGLIAAIVGLAGFAGGFLLTLAAIGRSIWRALTGEPAGDPPAPPAAHGGE